jgi:lipoprotein signal peptidase
VTLALWLRYLPALPGLPLRAAFALVFAGGASNLLTIAVLGGAPDFLILRHGIAVGDLAAWQAGKVFFNFGDLALATGMLLFLPGFVTSARGIRQEARASLELDRQSSDR